MSATLLSRDIPIDAEFRAMIPPLTPAEYVQLEANLLQDGCRDPLVTWNGILLDGHNRKAICDRQAIPYATTEVELADRDAAKQWIITNQFGRRNLQPFQRAELALQLEPMIAARSRQGERTDLLQNSAKSAPLDTREELARISGLSHDTIYKAKVIADCAPEDVKEKLRCGDPGMSIHKAYTAIMLQDKNDETKARLMAVVTIENPGLIIGDFREKSAQIPDASVELIFTDPPYDRDSIPLYEDTARIAARILKPGGSLISYCGHVILPEVLPRMQTYLRYWWINACVHGDTAKSRMQKYGIVVGWKPMLWFVRETRGDVQTFISDVVSAKREKTEHEWQQAESEAAYYIEQLTSPTGLVVDFFTGGGTTCVAAQRLGRPWIGFEIDPVTAETADKRIQAEAQAVQA